MRASLLVIACWGLGVGVCLAGTNRICRAETNDAVVIAVAVPCSRIVSTAFGYRIEDESGGSRMVYRTALGYRIEGGHGRNETLLIRTANGWRVEDGNARAEAMRADRRH